MTYDPMMTERQQAEDRVVQAVRDINHYAIDRLPMTGTLRMHYRTYAEIVMSIPPMFMFDDGLVNIAPGEKRLIGLPVELDETIPVNEIHYRIEQSVTVDLVQEETR